MGGSINQLRGTTTSIVKTLKSQGFGNTEALLSAARTPIMRKKLAALIGSTPQHVLELANRADLSRIKGVAGVYSDLLELVGINSVRTLARQNAELLHEALVEINQARCLTKVPPSVTRVKSWISQAKALRGAISL